MSKAELFGIELGNPQEGRILDVKVVKCPEIPIVHTYEFNVTKEYDEKGVHDCNETLTITSHSLIELEKGAVYRLEGPFSNGGYFIRKQE